MAKLILSSNTEKQSYCDSTGSNFYVHNHRLSATEYAETFITALYGRVFDDIINNLVGLDERVKDSLVTDTSKVVRAIGLKEIVVDAFKRTSTSYIKVTAINGTIIYSKNYKTDTDSENDILVVDATDSQSNILFDIYLMLYYYSKFLVSAVKMSNKPIVRFNELRGNAESTSAQLDDIRKSVSETLNSMHKLTGFAVFDAKDSFEFSVTDPSKFDKLLEQTFSLAVAITGLPPQYMFGRQYGALQTSGDADAVMLDRTLSGIYTNKIEPLLKRVYDILNFGKYNVIYKDNYVSKIKAVAGLLPAVERSDILSDNNKKEIIEGLTGVKVDA